MGIATFFTAKHFLDKRFEEENNVVENKSVDVILLLENELDENEKLVYEAIKKGLRP
ncbi:hemagglutinin [Acidianus sulfidivorans]|uniref:hemagglutinin n=1 Tax=Acidianus sulfidivorans TaxID=312539 RepID=UPI0013A57E1B|nr:hemagglutinin [Acidianus sulfidivorans]